MEEISVMNETEAKHAEVLLEAIDKALQLFGEANKSTIYSVFERKCQIRRDKIPERLEDFHKTLEGIFGATATDLIDKTIVKEFYNKIGLELKELESWKLIDCFDEARKIKGVC